MLRSLVRAAAALATAAAGTAAFAQDVPAVISPLRVESDHNGVNLVDGKTTIDPPVLSVPGAPNLRFDRIQNAAPYIKGTVPYTGGAEYSGGSYSVVTGDGSSDSFHCFDVADCTSIKGSGSTLRVTPTVGGTFKYREAGSAALYTFSLKHVHTMAHGSPGTPGVPGSVYYHLGDVSYPNGEVITYTYQGYYHPPLAQTFYRPTTITSNLGFFISISYQSDDFDSMGWGAVGQATIYASAAPATPLGRLTYTGTTITDLGGRVYTCQGCNNTLGLDIEVGAGMTQLPGEVSPARQVVVHPSAPIVGSVVRDGVTWTYAYDNLRPGDQPFSYFYDRLTVAGPNGYNNVYNVALVGQLNARRVVIAGSTDSIGRLTSYGYDEYFRPWRAISPEGNEVRVAYDQYGNIIWRTTKAKPGLGSDITETALFPTDTCASAGTPILCYRPQWFRDGLGRQTDYAYNAAGQLTEQTDPADADGVQRKTYIEYETGGLSRRSVVRICCAKTAAGTSYELRTEYEYWGGTFLPSVERRIDAAQGVTLVTNYSYDGAGRLLSVDGPLPGTDDATYVRYDQYGRKTWEIGARSPDGLRLARRFTYRDSDDKLLSTEDGTLPDASSIVLTPLSRADLTYDSRRNPVRETVSASGTAYGVVDRSFDDQGRLECEARRMNPAAFGAAPSACTLGTQGTQGPDRITRNIYDAAGQLLIVQRAYGTPLQQNYAAYSYSPNGKQTSVTDANGNRAEMTFDGYDRQRRWIFPSKTAAGVANQSDYEEYGYDLVGNRISLRKRDGTTLTFQYDALNRMILKSVPASASGAPGYSVFYAYDARGLQTDARFGSAAGPGIHNAYDGFGRLSSSTTNMGGFTRALSHQYDAAGNRIRVTHPDDNYFTYDRDALGRAVWIRENGAAWQAYLTYHPSGARKMRHLWSVASLYDYDPVLRLTSLNVLYGPQVNNSLYTFAYNPASQVVEQTRGNDAYAANSAYNVSRPYAVNGLNQYTSAGPAAFAYDANGNLTSDGATSFAYDAENRLVSASGARNASLAYDPLGRLFQTSGGSAGTTQFLYDGDALAGEYDGAGALLRRYMHGPGVDEPFIWYEGATLDPAARRRLQVDRQGSIVSVSDTMGNILAIDGYDPWGVPNAANLGRFQYTGQAWIPELGMYYYKARIYSPTLGRFMQTDPVGYDDQINLYAYVGNDPVNRADPTGLTSIVPNTCSRLGSLACSGTYGPSWNGIGTKGRVEAGQKSAPPRGRGLQFIEPTNPPQNPPFTGPTRPAPSGGGIIGPGPNGTTIRYQPASPETAARGYPTGYWRQTNASGQPIDPSTGLPPGNVTPAEAQARTHVPLPEPPMAEPDALRRDSASGWINTFRIIASRAGAIICALFCEAPAY